MRRSANCFRWMCNAHYDSHPALLAIWRIKARHTPGRDIGQHYVTCGRIKLSQNATGEPDSTQPDSRDNGLHYAGFWRRFGAYWLDFLIFLPAIGVSFWLGEKSRVLSVSSYLPWLVFSTWFHVYLVKRYGGTPGKLMLGIRIARVDGLPVGYRESLLRYSVLFALSTLQSIALAIATLGMSDSEYLSLSFDARSARMVEIAPSWYQPITILMNVWIWSEFVVMLTNKRRRALHDFMAGTVVVRAAQPDA
jgi:uncharacterized RDD family membrane protein YckC